MQKGAKAMTTLKIKVSHLTKLFSLHFYVGIFIHPNDYEFDPAKFLSECFIE